MIRNLPNFLVLCSLILFNFSCTKSSIKPNTSTTSNLSTTITTGTWTITQYSQGSEDKTSLFRDYTFTFASQGVLKAMKNGDSTTGSWVLVTPITYYGTTVGTNTSVTINLGMAAPLSLLSKSWNVDSTNTTVSKLSLVSPEPTDNAQLIFTKQ
jgi:hypothetical protein